MDLWVVAAAAGAGYIAKNLQNLTVDKKENLWEQPLKYPVNDESESRNFLQRIRYNTCPLRRLAQDDEIDVKFSTLDGLGKRNSTADLASTSAGISGQQIPGLEGGKSISSSRFKKGKFIRSRRGGLKIARPLISLENIFDYELSKDGEIMEQNVFGMLPSASAVRPLLVTDGIGFTSRSSSASLARFDGGVEEGRGENVVGSKVRSTMFRSLSSQHLDSSAFQRKPKKTSSLVRTSCFSDSVPRRPFGSSGSDGLLLFIMGMSIGILSAKTAIKREVDDLNKQLKQTQNLVQDLHDELNMKEMITVKELVNEDYHLPSEEKHTHLSIREPISSPNQEAKELTANESLKARDDNTENLELRSKIEEELRAELEMLEHNMNTSALERISDVVELDPDYEPDLTQGDLKPTMAMAARYVASESSDESTDATSNIAQPPNYAVSPWELSFRLHELIESRLKARVKELKIALRNSENRVQALGSQNLLSGRRLSYSETEFSCSPQSPIYDCGHYTTDGSLVKNISSNSLDSIKEVNGSFVRVTDADQERGEEKSISSYGVDHGMHSSVEKLIDDQFNEEKSCVSHDDAVTEKGRAQEESVQDIAGTWDTQTSRSLILDEDFESENDEETDESEMLLIKKIVEKSRSGSAFAFNFDEFRTQV